MKPSLYLLLAVTLARAAAPSLRPTELKCEYRVNPQGIDETQPRLSWILAAANPVIRDLKQSAYRTIVASTPAGAAAIKGDLWDSGRVDSSDSVLVHYEGKALESGMRAYWRVQVWDQAGAASGWSQTAQWSMGLLNPGDWKAKWIGLDETAVYQHPGSPFQTLKPARWIWFDEGD